MRKLKELIENDELDKFELRAFDEDEEYENFLIKIVSQIVKLRVEKRISQKELAKKLGTKQSAISRFENFSSNPTLKFLFKVLKALDAEIEITDKSKGYEKYNIVINDKESNFERYYVDSIEKVWERVS
ncbi:helix-turn-helix transcriptional regulator [Thermosipho ferrireducens]|uniref:Helix-turn-helix transcriptional regulator n=1 Tax=Thermosipho ferrireducens TaxID=2571116 RepID=A0ABX7SAP2_9BACT|nr:helix-turn-helix transcriptional regulator [Thermosipho ferrireducens]QTA38521.1 helix-turn-helix transcriptional regulator [Thermosipho ferrireducens]